MHDKTPQNPLGAGRNAIELDPAGIAELAGKGLTKQQIADFFGIHITTLLSKQRTDPNIKRAFDIGRARANYNVSNVLYTRALAGDAAAIIWYEKTRTGRSDRVDVFVKDRVDQELAAFLDYLADNLSEAEYDKIETLVANYARTGEDSTRAANED